MASKQRNVLSKKSEEDLNANNSYKVAEVHLLLFLTSFILCTGILVVNICVFHFEMKLYVI